MAPRTVLQTALLCAGLGGVIFVITFSVLGALAPKYDSVTETISMLEFTPLGELQRINFYFFGSALAFFSIGMRRGLRNGRASLMIPALQFLCGIAVIWDGVFIRLPLHLLADVTAFNSAPVVIVLFAWRVWRDRRWKGWAAYSLITGMTMAALLIGLEFSVQFGGPRGLLEKTNVVIGVAWWTLLTTRLLLGGRLDFPRRDTTPAA